MIERMQIAVKKGVSAEDKAQFWVGLVLAAATAILLFASFLDLAMI